MEHKASLGELGQHVVMQAATVLPHQVADDLRDGMELCLGGHAVGRTLDDAGRDLPLQAGHPDLVELVEIAAEDGEELQSLEEGGSGVERLVQHPAVELQPGELAVDVERRIPQIQRGGRLYGELEVSHDGNVSCETRSRT